MKHPELNNNFSLHDFTNFKEIESGMSSNHAFKKRESDDTNQKDSTEFVSEWESERQLAHTLRGEGP